MNARYFGTSEEFWMNLESNCELRLERRTLRDRAVAITPDKLAVAIGVPPRRSVCAGMIMAPLAVLGRASTLWSRLTPSSA